LKLNFPDFREVPEISAPFEHLICEKRRGKVGCEAAVLVIQYRQVVWWVNETEKISGGDSMAPGNCPDFSAVLSPD